MTTQQQLRSSGNGMLWSADQIAALPPDQQAAVIGSLPAQQRGAAQMSVQQAMQQALVRSNRNFMRKSVEKIAACQLASGSGTSATFSPGTTLTFNMPTIGSAYVKALLITYNISITPATGTAAAYAANAAAPFNIFSELDVNYNGAQIKTHPYVLKLLDQLRGFGRGAQNAVIGGNNNATIAAQIVGTTPLVVGSANVWQGKLLLPLNALGEDTVPGLLPIMGVGNQAQLKLTCVSSFLGFDPLINPVATTGGTGAAITVNSGTVTVDAIYLDGSNMDSNVGLTLSLAGEPTLQYFWDTPLNPLNQGLLQRQHISTLLEHWYTISIVIDGVQSSKFAAVTNLTQFEMSPDSVGQQKFVSYNVANNVVVYDYYDRIRRMTGQDLDEGVIIWVAAPTRGVIDPDNRAGNQVLNMRDGGYPATTHGYQVTAVSSTNFTPRVETFLLSMNYAGLKVLGQ
jgi:hypothetical protein